MRQAFEFSFREEDASLIFKRCFVIDKFKMKSFYPFFLGNLFLLVIVFSVFLSKAMKPCGFTVVLPRAISSEPISATGCVVSILKDNSLYIGNREVTLDELKYSMGREKKAVLNVLIKADQHADIGTLVKVWDLLRKMGAGRVSIATNG